MASGTIPSQSIEISDDSDCDKNPLDDSTIEMHGDKSLNITLDASMDTSASEIKVSNRKRLSLEDKEHRRKELEQRREHKQLEKERKKDDRLRKEREKEDERKRKELDRQKREQERKKREEEKQKREEEKQKREEEKQKREKEKEVEKKKREEEKIKREREKEEERLRKDQEKTAREEERRKKEAEKLQKESDKKKEEQERTRKKERQSAILMNFLVKSDKENQEPEPTDDVESEKRGNFIPFQLKKDQRLANPLRLSPQLLTYKVSNLDKLLKTPNLFPTLSAREILQDFKTPLIVISDVAVQVSWWRESGKVKPQVSPCRRPTPGYLDCRVVKRHHYTGHAPIQMFIFRELPDVQLISVETDPTIREHCQRGSGGTVWFKAKYFHFFENYRPPYYGTWRKKSVGLITGRRPFAKETCYFDYDVDSDDEWEEEEPGESITHSDNEEEEKLPDEEEEEDDEFFVPHGYLSDDEGVSGDENEETPDAEDRLEMKKLRQRLSLAVYDNAHKRGLQKIRPRIIGPMWIDCDSFAASDEAPLDDNLLSRSKANFLEAEKENIFNSGAKDGCKSAAVKKLESKLTFDNLWTYRVHTWHNPLPITFASSQFITDTKVRKNSKTVPQE
ncbi:Chromatin assembly factor 1, subunit A, partial [Cichlidogyrus casuarinus]